MSGPGFTLSVGAAFATAAVKTKLPARAVIDVKLKRINNLHLNWMFVLRPPTVRALPHSMRVMPHQVMGSCPATLAPERPCPEALRDFRRVMELRRHNGGNETYATTSSGASKRRLSRITRVFGSKPPSKDEVPLAEIGLPAR